MVKMRILIAIIALALVAMFIPSVALADPEDWKVDLSLTTSPDIGHVPGLGYHFGFGAKDGAVDEYAAGDGDEIAPPDPMAGVNAYFYYPANSEYTRNLVTSVVAPAASITWPLRIKMVGSTGDAQMTISWPDISSVPAKYVVLELQDTEGTTLADMRSIGHYTFSASQGQTYNFQIRAEREVTSATINPEEADYNLASPSDVETTITWNDASDIDSIEDDDTDTLVKDTNYTVSYLNGTATLTILDAYLASELLAVNDEVVLTINFDVGDPATFTITAVFEEIPKYDLTISSTVGGNVTTPGEGTFIYDAGTVVDLVATPDAGYRFVEWTGNVSTIADVNAAETIITMNGDYDITANFIAQPPRPRPPSPTPPVEYDLTIDSTVGGEVTEPGEGEFTYRAGKVVDLVAEAEENYRFVNWTGDVGTIADVYAAETTITMSGDYEITANFIVQYDLTIDSTDGGSVTIPGEGTFTYDAGTVVDLVAEAEENYRFVEWTGDVGTIADVNAAATNITMSGDYEITANFIVQYDLTIDSTDGGSVTIPGEGTFTYDAGTVVDLVAEAEENYRFVNWTGDIDTIADVDAAATNITMNSDYSITANFKARVNWPLIGGIIAAVVVAGLVIFFVRRRRAA